MVPQAVRIDTAQSRHIPRTRSRMRPGSGQPRSSSTAQSRPRTASSRKAADRHPSSSNGSRSPDRSRCARRLIHGINRLTLQLRQISATGVPQSPSREGGAKNSSVKRSGLRGSDQVRRRGAAGGNRRGVSLDPLGACHSGRGGDDIGAAARRDSRLHLGRLPLGVGLALESLPLVQGTAPVSGAVPSAGTLG